MIRSMLFLHYGVKGIYNCINERVKNKIPVWRAWIKGTAPEKQTLAV